jgi:hypothetical protein
MAPPGTTAKPSHREDAARRATPALGAAPTCGSRLNDKRLLYFFSTTQMLRKTTGLP